MRDRYGFGVAGVILRAEPYLPSEFQAGLDPAAGRDFLLTTIPPLFMAVIASVVVLATMSSGSDRAVPLEVMLIGRTEPAAAPPLLAKAAVSPEPAVAPEPVPVLPTPVPPAQPAPLPPSPPPAPPKRVAVKPVAPPTPAPVLAMPKPAAFDAQPLQDAQRQARLARERTPLDALKPAIALAPAVHRQPIPAATPERPRRFAAVRASTSPTRVRPNTAPIIAAAPHLEEPVPAAQRRRSVDRARPARDRMPPRPVALASAAPVAAVPAPVQSRTRRTALAPETRQVRREVVAVLASPTRPTAPSVAPPAARGATRAGPVGPERTPARAAGPSLAGVALASLAACVSDREEEFLKRRLVTAVTTQRECVSREGTYRFVETKNLNAFLMMIERAPRRQESDRCAELTNAIACLAGSAGR